MGDPTDALKESFAWADEAAWGDEEFLRHLVDVVWHAPPSVTCEELIAQAKRTFPQEEAGPNRRTTLELTRSQAAALEAHLSRVVAERAPGVRTALLESTWRKLLRLKRVVEDGEEDK